MPDNLEIKGPADPYTINAHQEHEIRYWTKEFGCTKAELILAIGIVGNSVEDVRKFFE